MPNRYKCAFATTKVVITELNGYLEKIRQAARDEARPAAGLAQAGLVRLHKLKAQAMAINALSRPRAAPKARAKAVADTLSG